MRFTGTTRLGTPYEHEESVVVLLLCGEVVVDQLLLLVLIQLSKPCDVLWIGLAIISIADWVNRLGFGCRYLGLGRSGSLLSSNGSCSRYRSGNDATRLLGILPRLVFQRPLIHRLRRSGRGLGGGHLPGGQARSAAR